MKIKNYDQPGSKRMTLMENENRKTGRSNRGFASMDAAKQKEIASRGGKAAHEKGTAHEFSSSEAAAAGRKGGQARRAQAQAKTPTEATAPTEQVPALV
jgi:general stress protein YciG